MAENFLSKSSKSQAIKKQMVKFQLQSKAKDLSPLKAILGNMDSDKWLVTL